MDGLTRVPPMLLLLGLVPAVAAAQGPEAGPQAPAPAPVSTPAEPRTAAPVPPQAPSAPPPASQELIYRGEATSILGRQVTGPDRKAVGRIVDVLVDEAGQPRAVVVDLGGFMGIGNRRIAVAWRALRFAPGAEGGKTVTLDMTADQIRATPEFKSAARPVTVAAPPAAPAAAPAAPPARPEAPPSGQP